MTALGREQMEDWKNRKQRVRVCSQGGGKKEGRIIDFDDTGIVLEEGGEEYGGYTVRKICHNWFSVEEATGWE
ncbi:MAG: hypothetical protein HFJ29_07965 [Clostridia bacterium]|nr:hypothetical protein [Clostridia bacterium]MCI9246067.1 hypothetical protein [Clostridia bacterium]